MTKTSAYSYNL